MTIAESTIDYGDNGERVTPDRADYVFYGHLSLYILAVPFIPPNARVLDAGCGTGYGASRLHRYARETVGVDASAKAVSYCRARYAVPGLAFTVVDLNAPLAFADGVFDFIFSSNAMEHVAQIDVHLEECRRLLSSAGRLFAAVPAITNPEQLETNIRNEYHVTNLTTLGWATKLGRYFESVRAFRHWPRGETNGWPGVIEKALLPPEENVAREGDFFLEEMPIDVLTGRADNLNATFLAERPRPAPLPPHVDEFVPHAWAEGAIQARVRSGR